MKNRILCIFLVFCVASGLLMGCASSKENVSDTKDIEIRIWNAGLGIEWLENMIDGFEKKYPEYKVNYSATADAPAVAAAFGLEDTDTTDLYIGMKEYDTTYLEPLNEVLDATVDGETKSIKEKFDPSYLALEEKDGNYYNLTDGGGLLGFVYNKQIFEDAGIETLPRTTDELVYVCSVLDDYGVSPICHFGRSGYYSYINDVWFAQYNGIEYYKDFYQNPTKEKMLAKDGRYEAIKVHEKINTPEYVLSGSNSSTHVFMQTKFLEGKAAMMVSGSWLANEMSFSDNIDNFEMMKMPVISSIIDNLETVKTEAILRKLITAIDKVTDGTEPENTYKDGANYVITGNVISAADWERVRAARNTVSANYSGGSCFIPTYSNAKEGAKEFLKYMYSDEGYRIYLDTLHVQLPLSLSEGSIDTSEWNSFEQNQAKLTSLSEHVVTYEIMNKNPLFTAGGTSAFAYYEFVYLMCTQNENDRQSADDVWDYISKTVDEQYDQVWMANIK